MTRPSVAYVEKWIADRRYAAERFIREHKPVHHVECINPAEARKYQGAKDPPMFPVPCPKCGQPVKHWEIHIDVYLYRDVSGIERSEPVVSVRDWRRRLGRLIREARKRKAAGDWAWFDWLAEFGSMVSETLHDDYAEQYDRTITRGGGAITLHKKNSINANADAELLREFQQWQRRAASQLMGLSAGERVEKFKIAKQPLGDRKTRRINRLRDGNKIPDLGK